MAILMCLESLAQACVTGHLQSPRGSSISVQRRLVPCLDCDCNVHCYECVNSTHMLGLPCRLGCRVGMGSSRPGSLPDLGHLHRRRGSSRRPRSHTLAH